jgi:hypothetical protein
MTQSEPLRALSIRQPWAWAIFNAGKPIENRARATKIRGRILIHASSMLPREDFLADSRFIDRIMDEDRIGRITNGQYVKNRREIPPLKTLKETAMGGIVGSVEIVDCVMADESPWFMGPYGYILRNAKPLPFLPCKGQLGFFVRDWPDAYL